MKIRKFEARTMKEALEMVKIELGPDAIILSAKEITKGLGLSAFKAIEITAAYSEVVLQQKKFVQSKMSESAKNKFSQISARSQREIMQRMIEDKIKESQSKEQMNRYSVAGQTATLSNKKYIEIDEDQLPKTTEAYRVNSLQKRYTVASHSGAQTSGVAKVTGAGSNKDKIAHKNDMATQIARTNQAIQTRSDVNRSYDASAATKANSNILASDNSFEGSSDVINLKSEIEQLKKIILDFKKVPQSFVSSYPGSDYGIDFNLSGQFERLTARGLLPEVAGQILTDLQRQCEPKNYKNSQIVEAYLAKIMLSNIRIDNYSGDKFHFFVGPSGSGKSSSMIKLASQLILKEKKRVALISTDTIKVGADEQMKIFSQILNIPFVAVRSPSDWNRILPYLHQVDHVLVDFASLSLKNEEELNYLQQMKPHVSESIRTHLVLSSKLKDVDIIEIGNKYKKNGYDDIIFTALDEATLYGSLYNATQKLQVPLFAFGIGPKVPDDLEMATPERVLDLILEISKNYQPSPQEDVGL